MKKFYIPFLILIVIAIISVVYIYISSFPIFVVAKINNQKIYLSDYKKRLDAAVYFYNLQKKNMEKNMLKINSKQDDEYKKNLKTIILQNMIEDKIIDYELNNVFNVSNLEEVINQKINEALKEKNIVDDIKFLYNLNLEDFKKILLEPVALREILNIELEKQNIQNFDYWFLKTKQKYDVKIYLNNVKWNKEKGIVE